MCRFLVLVLILCLPIIADAENHSVTTGLYKVYFDLGLPSYDAYNVIVSPENESKSISGGNTTAYQFTIDNTVGFGRSATVIITHYEKAKPILSSEDVLKLLEHKIIEQSNLILINLEDRLIDGGVGAVASYRSKDVEKVTYDAIYQPTFDPSHTFVEIVTPCPWDEGTQQLLKTFHVEKVK